MKAKRNKFKIAVNLVTAILTILIIVFLIIGIKVGIFKSPDVLVNYMKQFGILAPFLFILLLIVQVIFPVIPGGLVCLVGVIAFGPLYGFIYNYIGLCMGSIIVFIISRNYGQALVQKLFSQETIDKYIGPTKAKHFPKVLFAGILLPGAPDDLLCYAAGLTPMRISTFVLIIIIGKPLTLIGYSMGFDIFNFIFH